MSSGGGCGQSQALWKTTAVKHLDPWFSCLGPIPQTYIDGLGVGCRALVFLEDSQVVLKHNQHWKPLIRWSSALEYCCPFLYLPYFTVPFKIIRVSWTRSLLEVRPSTQLAILAGVASVLTGLGVHSKGWGVLVFFLNEIFFLVWDGSYMVSNSKSAKGHRNVTFLLLSTSLPIFLCVCKWQLVIVLSISCFLKFIP